MSEGGNRGSNNAFKSGVYISESDHPLAKPGHQSQTHSRQFPLNPAFRRSVGLQAGWPRRRLSLCPDWSGQIGSGPLKRRLSDRLGRWGEIASHAPNRSRAP